MPQGLSSEARQALHPAFCGRLWRHDVKVDLQSLWIVTVPKLMRVKNFEAEMSRISFSHLFWVFEGYVKHPGNRMITPNWFN